MPDKDAPAHQLGANTSSQAWADTELNMLDDALFAQDSHGSGVEGSGEPVATADVETAEGAKDSATHAEDPVLVRYEQLVRFEMRAPKARGRKEDQIRREFGLSMPQYYYQLRKAVDCPEISKFLPREVTMLRARRATRSSTYSPGS